LRDWFGGVGEAGRAGRTDLAYDMNLTLTESQRTSCTRAQAIGREHAADPDAAAVIRDAARGSILAPGLDPLTAVLACEAMAEESPAAAFAYALHVSVLLGLGTDDPLAPVAARDDFVAALALSSEEIPAVVNGQVQGRATWVGPLTDHGVAVIGAWGGEALAAYALRLDAPGVRIEPMPTAALNGFICGHVICVGVAVVELGSTTPFMAAARLLLAAAGLGMGRRALREALTAARGHTGRGAGGEQTVQGLLADAATEIDAARLLTWKAASAPVLSLADTSMAKLVATEATGRAVLRATQVVGVESFRRGHILERLSQDVRALELFAGRTEALREAVAGVVLRTRR
jgi:alkylation response protein AidB-like acyl-CoA dehydrogenase